MYIHILWTSCTCKHTFFFISSPYTMLINTQQHNTIYTSSSNLAAKALRSIYNRKASNRAPAVLQDPPLPTEITRSTMLRYAQPATHIPPAPALTWGTQARGPFALSSRLPWRAVALCALEMPLFSENSLSYSNCCLHSGSSLPKVLLYIIFLNFVSLIPSPVYSVPPYHGLPTLSLKQQKCFFLYFPNPTQIAFSLCLSPSLSELYIEKGLSPCYIYSRILCNLLCKKDYFFDHHK